MQMMGMLITQRVKKIHRCINKQQESAAKIAKRTHYVCMAGNAKTHQCAKNMQYKTQ